MGKVFSLPHRSRLPWTAQSILELAPGPIVVWSADRSNCILNDAARKMTGFTEREFRDTRTLWIGRVHPDDQQAFLNFWHELERTEKTLTCDYRFLQKGRKKELKIRDYSASLRNAHGEIDTIISTYADISDLLIANDNTSQRTESADQPLNLIRPLLHEIQNSLHVIRMGVEFMSIDKTNSFGLQSTTRGIEELDRLANELHEYCFPIRAQRSAVQPQVALKEVIKCVQTELHHQGISVRILDRSALVAVQLELVEFLRALKHLVKFCQVLLPPCGELEVEAGQDSVPGQAYLALKIDSAVAGSIGVDEKNAFRPFLRINGIHVGLGMAIAQQILRRLGGDILFRKESGQRVVVTVLLKT